MSTFPLAAAFSSFVNTLTELVTDADPDAAARAVSCSETDAASEASFFGFDAAAPSVVCKLESVELICAQALEAEASAAGATMLESNGTATPAITATNRLLPIVRIPLTP